MEQFFRLLGRMNPIAIVMLAVLIASVAVFAITYWAVGLSAKESAVSVGIVWFMLGAIVAVTMRSPSEGIY